jgi:hypothetical protein
MRVNVSPPSPLRAGDQTLTVVSGFVSTDAYDDEPLDPGARELNLTVRVSNDGPEPYTFNSRNVALIVAGTRVRAELVDGGVEIEPGRSSDDVVVAVNLPEYAGGPATVVFVGTDSHGADTEATAALTLPAP